MMTLLTEHGERMTPEAPPPPSNVLFRENPDWANHSIEFALLCCIGLVVWPWYWRRPRDYFKDMRKAFRHVWEERLCEPKPKGDGE